MAFTLPSSAEAMAAMHAEWASRIWKEAGFPAAAQVHIVTLKPVLARVLQEGGETAPNRMAADAITRQLQSGLRHWDRSQFIEWCASQHPTPPHGAGSSTATPVRSSVLSPPSPNRSRPMPSRRGAAKGRPLPACDASLDGGSVCSDAPPPSPPKQSGYDLARAWAAAEVEAMLEDAAAMSSVEARVARVKAVRAETAALRKVEQQQPVEEHEPPLLDEAERAAAIDELVAAALHDQRQAEQAAAKVRAEADAHALQFALAHARERSASALVHAATSQGTHVEKDSWHQAHWDSLRAAIERAEEAGVARLKMEEASEEPISEDTSTGEVAEGDSETPISYPDEMSA